MNFKEYAHEIGKYFVPDSGFNLHYEGTDDVKQALIFNKSGNIVRKDKLNTKFWVESLPYFLLLMDEKGDVKLSDLLKVFQSIIDEMIIKYENLHYFLRPDVQNKSFRNFFIWLFKINDEFLKKQLNSNRKIRQYYEIYKQRGTVQGLSGLIQLVFEVKCKIKERIDVSKEFPQIIFPFAVKKEQVFEVELSGKLQHINPLKRLISQHKPIHTICIVTYIEKDGKKVLTVL